MQPRRTSVAWLGVSLYLAIPVASLISGCFEPTPTPSSSASASPTSSPSATYTVPAGARAAKFIFRQSSSGSFDSPASNGTTPAAGSGHAASRVFNADGTTLSTWPSWIKRVEIGISGSNNTSATHPDCARFAASGEETSATCNFDLSAATSAVPCGAPAGFYRVSEMDCGRGTISTGSGLSTDGVYIRVTFSRDTSILGPQENILAVLEYSASVLNSAPATPSTCFTNGVFDPTDTRCSDMSWSIYLKHSTSETVQPYLMLVPPALASVNATANTGGSGFATKQIILPFAADSTLSVLQISRIKALATPSATDTGTYNSTCNPSQSSGSNNSALCVGMVFSSLTLYRM